MSNASNKHSCRDDVVIARVIKPRGIRGEVACSIETDFPERFALLGEATVLMPDGTALKLTVEDHWFHKGRVVLKFEDYDSMTDAQKLVGARLMIPESGEAPPAEDEFFERHLIGLEAVTSDGRRLGHVTRLMRTGGTDLLVVENDGREQLIPFADEICIDVDVSAKRITVNPPEGLLDL